MTIAYHLKVSSKRKTLSIKISDGHVIVYSPVGVSKAIIDSYIKQKQDWILKHITKQQQNRSTAILLLEEIEILQHCYQLKFKTQQRQSKVVEDSHALTVLTSNRVKKPKDKQLALLTEFCSSKLAIYCQNKAMELAAKVGRKPNNISVKLFKRRWGTCDNKGNLQFNTQLVTAPFWVIDYVVAHEVAHLIELNHSRRFWCIVRALYKDINEAEKWLKHNGNKLNIFKKE